MIKYKLELDYPDKLMSALRLKITYGKRFRYSIGISVPVKDWNDDAQCLQPEKDKGLAVINANIKLKLAVCRTVFNNELSLAQSQNKLLNHTILKASLDNAFNKKTVKHADNSLYIFIDEFIKNAEVNEKRKSIKDKRNRTSNVLKQAFNRLKLFEASEKYPVTFSSVDMVFYQKYLKYCAGKNLMINTVGRDIKCIKTWMNAALRDKVSQCDGHKHRDFKELSVDTDTVYLTDDELKLIAELDIQDPFKSDVRFWFLVGCYTGLRVSDYEKFTLKAVKSGVLDIVPQKTSEKGQRVAIPLHPILSKMIKGLKVLPEIPLEKVMNYNIKIICDLAEIREQVEVRTFYVDRTETANIPKYDMVSTHTARRSFATNLYLAGFPAISIMKITGHKTEKAFMKYIRITPRDTANQLAAFWKVDITKDDQ